MRTNRSVGPLGEYLRARREQVTPEQVGLIEQPGRRVPGLRRDEVADLAGVSPDYYLRLEQGRDRRPSEQVAAGLARALLLDEDGRRYLLKLAQPRPFIRRVDNDRVVSSEVMHLLAQWSHTPAFVTDANQNVLATNPLAHAMNPQLLIPGRNLLVAAYDAHAAFRAAVPGSVDHVTVGDDSDVDAVTQAARWEGSLREMTAALRYHGEVDDPAFQEVVGVLSVRHPFFRSIWAEHETRPHASAQDVVPIDGFGWAEFTRQTLDLPRLSHQFITIYFGPAGSSAEAAIAFLASKIAEANAVPQLEEPSVDEVDARRSIASRAESSTGENTTMKLSS